MRYQALYRRCRPQDFNSVQGQEHIVTTLQNQIVANKVGHAYLFHGTRGTGKTTVAKVFAKAVNCEHPLPDGSPCNHCPTCEAITKGRSLSVIEMDAASNNGVDNIRDIKENVQYKTEARYKVYIIDEVHMLSNGAFNALLKTLEEPPSHVIFILATTEPNKIPETILSRCQKYAFKRVAFETIYSYLEELLKKEGVEAEEKALRYIARAADGSMRDSLSILEEVITFNLGQKLTYDRVIKVLGTTDTTAVRNLIWYIAKGAKVKALDIIEQMAWEGVDFSVVTDDLTWYLRNLLMYKSTEGAIAPKLELSDNQLNDIQILDKDTELDAVMRYLRIFAELPATLKYTSQKRIAMEIAVTKAMTPQMEVDVESLLLRVRDLEREVEELKALKTEVEELKGSHLS